MPRTTPTHFCKKRPVSNSAASSWSCLLGEPSVPWNREKTDSLAQVITEARPRYHLYIQMILLALALQGLAGEQPYTFPRKSQLSNQPVILSIRARIGACRQCVVAVGLCLYRSWSEELSRALVLCPARSSRTIIGSLWPCAAALWSTQACARRAEWRRFECIPLCCIIKQNSASRDTEELHVE